MFIMTMTSRSLLLAASVFAIPATGALAQTSSNPSGNYSSAQSKMAPNETGSRSMTNPNKPGATGKAVVKGDNSTIAGDKASTAEQKTGGTGTSGR